MKKQWLLSPHRQLTEAEESLIWKKPPTHIESEYEFCSGCNIPIMIYGDTADRSRMEQMSIFYFCPSCNNIRKHGKFVYFLLWKKARPAFPDSE